MRQMLTLGVMTCLLGSAMVAGEANAATLRLLYVSATNACQPATPLELGGLRFRPLGIYNSKPESIYISCSLDTEFAGDQTTNDVRIYFNNSTAGTVQVNCTAQGGNRLTGVNNYPGSVDVSAGATEPLSFTGIDKTGFSYTHLNISCLLPKGIEMGTIRWQQQDVDDGL